MDYSEWRRQLIEGKRVKYGDGYKVYYPDRAILEVNFIPNKAAFIVAENKIEDMLFEDCKNRIIEFSLSENNKDVYALALEIDSYVGQIGISINSIAAFNESVSKRYSDYSKDELYGLGGIKYNPGDFSYRFFDNLICNSELKEILDAYYCINYENPVLSVSKPIAFKNDFFDNALCLIGINIINRMGKVLNKLDCTSDFIAFVSLGDMDIATMVSLMSRTVSSDKLNKIFPNIIN